MTVPAGAYDLQRTLQGNRPALWRGFMQSAEQFSERPAVIVEGKSLRYRQLREMALRLAATIQVHEGHRVHKRDLGSPLVAVFAHRSATAFASVLGSLLAGAGYAPLNRTFPVMRTRLMFERSECQTIIVDRESLPQLNALLDGDDRQLLVIAPDRQDLQWHRQQW